MNRSGPSLNGSASPDGTTNEIPIVLKELLKGGLALLWRGFEYARDLDAECWEFAVAGDALYQAGLSAIDLRWLIARGYVEFAPKTASSGGQKQFAEKNRPFEGKNTCFILTKAGAALALQVLSQTLLPVSPILVDNVKTEPGADGPNYSMIESNHVPQKPSWGRDRKELRFAGWIIKQFRWAAANQETILMAFEEDGWPPRIDDPLPQKLNQDPKSRLHDTIKCLNRNHRKRLIRFSGDGTGEGVLWTVVNGEESDS
jgi:hypothetical protein